MQCSQLLQTDLWASSSQTEATSRKISSNSSSLTEPTLRTRLKKGMKNALMYQHDKIMPWKRFLIVTVNNQLKNICQIKHTRHRCLLNFIINLLSALFAFSFFNKKPSINTAEGVCTSLFPACRLGRTHVRLTACLIDGRAAIKTSAIYCLYYSS